jgi:hypothetical protein
LFLLGHELQARMEVQHCTVIERLIEVTENENLPTWFNKMPQVDNAVVPAWREEALLLKLSIICLELTYKIIIGKAPYCETLVNKWSGKPWYILPQLSISSSSSYTDMKTSLCLCYTNTILSSAVTWIVPSWEFPNAELVDQIHLIWILKVELCWYMPLVSCIRFGNQSSAGICDFGRGLRLWELLTDINPVLAHIVWYNCGICCALLNHASEYVERYRNWSPISKLQRHPILQLLPRLCWSKHFAHLSLFPTCSWILHVSLVDFNGIVEVSQDQIQSNPIQPKRAF